jgi:hypothetical protein
MGVALCVHTASPFPSNLALWRSPETIQYFAFLVALLASLLRFSVLPVPK